MMTSALVVIATVLMATAHAVRPQKVEHFKIGFLAPWNSSFDDFSALTSASAISVALERIHSDPVLNKSMRFRSDRFSFVVRSSVKSKIHYTRFPRNFPVDGKVANLWRTC